MVSKSHVVAAYHGKLRELANLGIELTVITPPRWGNQKLEIRETGGYKLCVLPCLLSGYTHFHFYTARIAPIDADLIHLEEEPWSLVTYQFMRHCVKARKQTIFFTWQNILKNYPPPFAYFERFTLAHTAGAIAGNEEARRILETKGYQKPIRVIPQLGVDAAHFKKRDVTDLKAKLALEGKFVVGYVGRLVEAKGIADLIRALTLLPEQCAVVLVGGGEFQQQAQQLATKLSLNSRIRWVPQVPSLGVAEYMNLFDVLVLPSRTTPTWKEQFGRVLIEAMACETVPVGSNSGEIPNVIGDAGLTFAEGDLAELAAQLLLLYHRRDLMTELGCKARARVLEKFTHRRIAEETVRLYSEVLSERRQPRECALVYG
jgi:glycosyltransferase involved in cell wall biosynthesis